MNSAIVESPVGPLMLVSDEGKLIGCFFDGRAPAAMAGAPRGRDPILDLARQELAAFFAGALRTFTVPVAPRGTEFQRKVWKGLQSIPHGRTTSYGELARKIGGPKAVRAVGAANGANPICIIIPCHRVIGADGSLTGFGGGLDRKRFLLALERGEAPLL